MTTPRNAHRWAGPLVRVFFGLVAAASLAAPAGAQNLIVNGTFDHDVSGWTSANTDFLEIRFRSDAGNTLSGGSGPGSMEARNSDWSGGGYAAWQQVQVTGGKTYTLTGTAFVPGTPENDGVTVDYVVRWYDSDKRVLDWTYAGLWPVERGKWLSVTKAFTAPVEAVTARVEATVSTVNDPNRTQPAVAYFDDISFAEEGAVEARQVLFVPASASAHGYNGTFWTTTGWFASHVSVPVELKGAFLVQGQDNSGAIGTLTHLGTVPAGGFLTVSDMVAKLGGAGKSGGIYLEAFAQGAGLPAVLVSATTYTFTPNDQGPGGYGQGVPAVGVGTKAAVLIPGVFQGTDYRTNVGVINTSDVQVDITVAITGADGHELASEDWSLKPYGQKQVSVKTMGVNSAQGGFVTMTRTSTGGAFRAYATVVDQKTGDAVYTSGL